MKLPYLKVKIESCTNKDWIGKTMTLVEKGEYEWLWQEEDKPLLTHTRNCGVLCAEMNT